METIGNNGRKTETASTDTTNPERQFLATSAATRQEPIVFHEYGLARVNKSADPVGMWGSKFELTVKSVSFHNADPI